MVVIKQNVIYDSEHDLRTDIYFPNDTSSKTKILIFWHGGGFIRGSKDECKNFGIKFANAGFLIIVLLLDIYSLPLTKMQEILSIGC